MTPEQINYIREWARDGNKSMLTPDSLTIARLADALEQANEVAEEMWYLCPLDLGRCAFNEHFPTMRQNRRELLGDG